MFHQSLLELAQALNKREFSSRELTEYYLKRIKQFDKLNAFISINEEQALLAANTADHLLATGQGNLLTGIPMAHKDIFCTETLATTCGSKMLENFYSPYSATVVKKLCDQGAVVVGKTNMDEFAMGSTNKTSYFGPVLNPWNFQHVPGGSSGGSAAAVAADLIPYSTGSDTGGSIRQPAAFCGISGIKPTYGLVSRFGMVAFASSLDQAGPMARSAEDLALVLQAMTGFDEKDSTSLKCQIPNYLAGLKNSVKGLRLGLPSCFFEKAVDPAIQQAVHKAAKLFAQAGVEIIELNLATKPLWVSCYYVIACAEASSNLARFDGIRFGYSSLRGNTLAEKIQNTRSEGFGQEVKRRILTGTYVLSEGHFDAYYLQALKIRRLIQNELKQVFAQVDFLLGPTTPTCAFNLHEKIINPTDHYLADVFTVVANLAGVPAISIPAGFKDGLPIGIQFIGNHFSEQLLLNCAHFYQQQTAWHQTRPILEG